MKQTFKADSHPHYLFTPRDLTSWVKGLLRYEIPEGNNGLLQVVVYEGKRIFRDRLVSASDQAKFDSILAGVFREEWSFNPATTDGVFFTTWGSSSSSSSSQPSSSEPVHLAQLSCDDLKEIISKAVLQYSE